MPLLLALLALCGCNRPSFDTPEEAYRSFHRLVQQQEYDAAYQSLSQPTRQALEARAKKASEASGGAVKPRPLPLFFSNAAPPGNVTEISRLREEGDVATVRVLTSGQSHEVRLVREPSGWKVDLSQSLQP